MKNISINSWASKPKKRKKKAKEEKPTLFGVDKAAIPFL